MENNDDLNDNRNDEHGEVHNSFEEGNDGRSEYIMREVNDQIKLPKTEKITFSVGFRDVEETIRDFTGEEEFQIRRWVADFEDASQLFGWSDIQKVIFAKKSLIGLPKLFIQSESGLNSWKKLKTALVNEFPTIMRELASRRNIEIKAIFEYVIMGINSKNNKLILYFIFIYEEKSVSKFKEF